MGKHQSEVDSNNSKVSELIDEIGKLKKHLIQLEAMNTSLKHQFAKISILLFGNNQMISSLEQ